jgi:cytochrome c551/c552
MSRRSPLGAPALAAAVIVLAGAPAHADDGASLARDQGCLNCHHVGAQPSRQPSAQHLGDKLRRRGGGEEALRHLLDEMREHDAVPAHRRVSDAAALGVLRWMAQGGR